MTKRELELENLVLRNVMDCISEAFEQLEQSDEEYRYAHFVGSVMAMINYYPNAIKMALVDGYALDRRDSAHYSKRPDGEPVRLYPGGK